MTSKNIRYVDLPILSLNSKRNMNIKIETFQQVQFGVFGAPFTN